MNLRARPAAPVPAALVLALAAGCASPLGPAPSPMPLLVSDRGGAPRIYEEIEKGAARLVGSADGGGSHADTMPARLPGGDVVFVSDRDGAPAIYLATRRGVVRRLTRSQPGEPARDSAPAPCGADRIVFARAAATGAGRDLYTVRLDGTDLRRLTRDPADDYEPWGSRDGSAVAFVSDRGGAPRVWLIPDSGAADPEQAAVCLSDPGPRGPEGPPPGPGFVDRAPVFLGDGSIVFARAGQGSASQLFVMGGSGVSAGLRQITDPLTLPSGASEPVVVDDASLLLVAGPVRETGGGGGGRFAVYRIAVGGFNLSRVTRDRARYDDFTRRLDAQ